ncbi:hypothetical protein L7F22_048400 [Adiantum nelumboides]|nr:hypothetical protein [Adiantum nelumboides]
MIMFDADGITKCVDEWRTDLVAKMIGRLGLQKIMFEADEIESVQWLVSKYGSGADPFVDHSHVGSLECLRSPISWTGAHGWGRSYLRLVPREPPVSRLGSMVAALVESAQDDGRSSKRGMRLVAAERGTLTLTRDLVLLTATAWVRSEM